VPPKIWAFISLENPVIHSGSAINKALNPHKKSGVKAPFFLMGFPFTEVEQFYYRKEKREFFFVILSD